MRAINRIKTASRALKVTAYRSLFQDSISREIYSAQHELSRRYGGGSVGLTSHEFKVFSQNGEDGVIAEIFLRIGTTNRFFVEFGVENGSQCNTLFLAHTMGWGGVYFEPDPVGFEQLERRYRSNREVGTYPTAITASNVEQCFREAGVPEEPDLLSIDVDGNDYWIWNAINEFRPRVVIIEYNGVLDLDSVIIARESDHYDWDATADFGSSLRAMEELAEAKGYQLVHTESQGVNAFFVRRDLAVSATFMVSPRRSANHGFSGLTWHPE